MLIVLRVSSKARYASYLTRFNTKLHPLLIIFIKHCICDNWVGLLTTNTWLNKLLFLLPSAKRRAPDDSSKFKESWNESALWPKANVCIETTTLPSSWLQLAKDGMVCSLCTKYNKVPRSGKPSYCTGCKRS